MNFFHSFILYIFKFSGKNIGRLWSHSCPYTTSFLFGKFVCMCVCFFFVSKLFDWPFRVRFFLFIIYETRKKNKKKKQNTTLAVVIWKKNYFIFFIYMMIWCHSVRFWFWFGWPTNNTKYPNIQNDDHDDDVQNDNIIYVV